MKYCLGTVQFGMDYGIQGNGQPDVNSVVKILEYAYSGGINMLDTAAAYGTAENVVGGGILRNKNLSQMNIVSKLEPNAFDGADPIEWKKIAVKKAEESRQRLGVSRLYAYLFHNARYIFDPKAVEALQEVKEHQIADRIGISIYTPNEAMKALEYESVKAVQIPYNVFDQRLNQCGFFERAREQDVQVFARSTLLQGLVMMNPDRLPENVRFAENYLRKFLEICNRYDCSPLEAAVGYVRHNPKIDYVVFGVDNLKQLQEYLSIQCWSMPDQMLEELKAAFERVEERLVNPSMWGKGR